MRWSPGASFDAANRLQIAAVASNGQPQSVVDSRELGLPGAGIEPVADERTHPQAEEHAGNCQAQHSIWPSTVPQRGLLASSCGVRSACCRSGGAFYVANRLQIAAVRVTGGRNL